MNAKAPVDPLEPLLEFLYARFERDRDKRVFEVPDLGERPEPHFCGRS